MSRSFISVDEKSMGEFRAEMLRLERSLDRKVVNRIQTKRARPMLRDMKSNAPSEKIARQTAITTRQVKRPKAPRVGIRIGVINNSASDFPKLSAPALASVLEHGTKERFRRSAKMFGIVIGTASTGKVTGEPWLRPAWDRHVEPFAANCISDYEKEVL